MPAPVPVPALSIISVPAAEIVPDKPFSQETGTASWYGNVVHRRNTAGNEVFNRQDYSAAHRTLPLGSTIHVTNLENSKSISVQVTGRGPFMANRLIDLSYGAASELGFAAQGTARVRIEYADKGVGTSRYTILAAQYVEEENAKLLKERLAAKYETITIIPVASGLGMFYRVEVGLYATEEKARLVAGRLTLEGLEPIVIRKDQ